jgi:hypothetical protein
MGFANAAALACLRALGAEQKIKETDLQDWQEI